MTRSFRKAHNRSPRRSAPQTHVLQEGESVRLSQRRCPKKEDVAGKCTDSHCIGKVMVVNWRRPQLNPFIVLMFIHLENDSARVESHKRPTTTPRRVLLDTGADFNLVSHDAYAQLNVEKRPYQGLVHSIGGYSELESTVFLRWHFRVPGSKSVRSSEHNDPFHILQKGSDAKFDCIIGRPWILENWTEFLALVEDNRKKQMGQDDNLKA